MPEGRAGRGGAGRVHRRGASRSPAAARGRRRRGGGRGAQSPRVAARGAAEPRRGRAEPRRKPRGGHKSAAPGRAAWESAAGSALVLGGPGLSAQRRRDGRFPRGLAGCRRLRGGAERGCCGRCCGRPWRAATTWTWVAPWFSRAPTALSSGTRCCSTTTTARGGE